MPHLAQQSLEDARANLVKWIQRQSPQGSLRNKVTLVFDGQNGLGHWSDQPIGLCIFFTTVQSADDYIKEKVTEAKRPKSIIVVTNDREIQYFVRAQGANILSVEQFLQQGKIGRTRGSNVSPSVSPESAKKISMRDRYKINQELEDLWINKEE